VTYRGPWSPTAAPHDNQLRRPPRDAAFSPTVDRDWGGGKTKQEEENMKVFKQRRSLVTMLCVAGVAAGLTACGGDDDAVTAPESAPAGSGGAALDAARKNVEAHAKAPVKIGPSEPIGKPIPTGKTIAYINCGAEACVNVGKSMDEAAKVLGWKVKHINTQPTPQAIQAAFEEAVRANPDGVAELGFDKVTFERQLEKLKANKIPVLAATGTDPSGSGIDLQIIPPEENSKSTMLMADKVAIDSGGKGEVGVVELTDYPVIKIYTQAFKDQLSKSCPDCTAKTIQIQPTSMGKDAASKIANFLRANPKIGHLFLSLDDLGAGLPAAVQNAGAKMPKTYGHAPTAAGLEALRTGERTAATPGPTPEIAWQFMDAFARHFTSQSMQPDQKWQGTIIWGEEFGNLPASGSLPVVKDYQEQFNALWGK
jgi:ribose transport system substrate-binding protein